MIMSRVQLGLCAVAVTTAIIVAEGQISRVKPPPAVPLAHPVVFYVDPAGGHDANPGTESRPVKSIPAAVALLPDPVLRNVTIQLAAGRHTIAGDRGSLELMRRMRPGVTVYLLGTKDEKGDPSTLAWEGGPAIVEVTEGHWRLENIQVGSGSTRQRRGVQQDVRVGKAEVGVQQNHATG
jgi:hypothetical protein